MTDRQELLEKLNLLLQKQSQFQKEINELQLQITLLKTEEKKEVQASDSSEVYKIQKSTSDWKEDIIEKPVVQQAKKVTPLPKKPSTLDDLWEKTGIGSEIEQFIGTNLINKIGIAVVIIGVGIGAKYAIDNDLISPLVRILLGYFVGGLLNFFAYRLKKNYFNFSAVLCSGAMAIHYFITYAAYSYYSLFPNTVAFVLMVIITVITVALALFYNRQVIAHFGLVGAYLVPFLLKDPDSSVLVLFIYMTIINCGILFISTKKRWKPLNYMAFAATWIIFISWFLSKNYTDQITISLTFASLFFAIFYLVFLSYKLILKEKLKLDDIFFLVLNASVFYLIGLFTLDIRHIELTFGGLFTFINAIIHGFTAFLIYKYETENKNLFYWTLGIVVAFITIAIGLQFNESVSAILWSVEAAFIFWLGRNKKIILFDYLAITIVLLTIIQIISLWFSVSYNFYPESINEIYTPIFRLSFLSSLAVIASFSFIHYTSKKHKPIDKKHKDWIEVFNIVFHLFFLATLFFTFYTEITLFWNNIQIYTSYDLTTNDVWVKAFEKLNQDIFAFKTIWLFNFTLLFASILAFTNFKWLKNDVLNAFIFVLGGLMILLFMTTGIQAMTILRESYLSANLPANYDVNIFHLLIRYVAYMFFALLFYSLFRFSIPMFTNKNFIKIFEIVLSITIIWLCSSELIHWLSLYGTSDVYKFGLTILWGVFSFLLIGYGIWKKKKYLRITSIVLFAGTIIKLFAYDINNLETVPKTIVFISIGGLLLVVSFMYNKYRTIIFGSD